MGLRRLLPPDSAAHFGTLVAGFLLSVAFTLLLGFAGLKIFHRLVGRNRVAGRAAFAIGACLSVALLAFGEYRIRRAEARLAKADAGRLLMEESRTALSAAASRNQRYVAAVANVMGDGIIRPAQLDTPEKLAALKAKVARLRQLADGLENDTRADGDAILARVGALPIEESDKRAFELSFRQGWQRSIAITDESLSLSRQIYDVLEELARFMSDRLGTFHVENNELVFKSDADVAGYRQIIRRLVELDKRQREVVARAQQMTEAANEAAQP